MVITQAARGKSRNNIRSQQVRDPAGSAGRKSWVMSGVTQYRRRDTGDPVRRGADVPTAPAGLLGMCGLPRDLLTWVPPRPAARPEASPAPCQPTPTQLLP